MNIVLIIVDTLRYDHIAANGNPDVKTPNLDRLAARSWNFSRAFASSFPTIPHRTDVITGRYGAPFNPWKCLVTNVPTIPRVLAQHGYCSQLIHDTPHLVNGGHNFDSPFDAWTIVRGAEVDRSWISDSWAPLPNWGRDPVFDDIDMTMEQAIRSSHALTPYVQTNRHRRKPEDWNAARLFLTAADFLRDNTTRDDFFLWVDCFDPHEPWDAPPEFVKLYNPDPDYDGMIDPRAFHARLVAKLPAQARERLASFYKAKVSHMDRWLGEFLDALDQTGLDRNTAIILTADHGTNIGDRGNNRFGKMGPPVENEAHVPFLLAVPGAGCGSSEAIVQPQDVFATVLALADATPALPTDIESHDLMPIAQQGGPGPRALAVCGNNVGAWGKQGPNSVLFSAFDRGWRLGFAANRADCELQPLGSRDQVAGEHQDVVARLHAAAIEELARRGLDAKAVQWLRGAGTTPFPDGVRVNDAFPPPPGWRGSYWQNINHCLGAAR